MDCRWKRLISAESKQLRGELSGFITLVWYQIFNDHTEKQFTKDVIIEIYFLLSSLIRFLFSSGAIATGVQAQHSVTFRKVELENKGNFLRVKINFFVPRRMRSGVIIDG